MKGKVIFIAQMPLHGFEDKSKLRKVVSE